MFSTNACILRLNCSHIIRTVSVMWEPQKITREQDKNLKNSAPIWKGVQCPLFITPVCEWTVS